MTFAGFSSNCMIAVNKLLPICQWPNPDVAQYILPVCCPCHHYSHACIALILVTCQSVHVYTHAQPARLPGLRCMQHKLASSKQAGHEHVWQLSFYSTSTHEDSKTLFDNLRFATTVRTYLSPSTTLKTRTILGASGSEKETSFCMSPYAACSSKAHNSASSIIS